MRQSSTSTRRSRPTLSLLLLALLSGSSFEVVQAKRLAFRYDGSEHAYCKSGAYDMELTDLKVECSGDVHCMPGQTATVSGHISSSISGLPSDVNFRVKACKDRWCVFHTPTLDFEEMSFCSDFNVNDPYGNSACPAPGSYSFHRSMIWPKNQYTDWATGSFFVDLNFEALDTGNDYTHLDCKARFTVVDFDSESYSDTAYGNGNYTAATVGAVALLGVGAYAGFQERKRRLQSTPAIDLNDEDQDESSTVFVEMMGCTGGHVDSVRV